MSGDVADGGADLARGAAAARDDGDVVRTAAEAAAAAREPLLVLEPLEAFLDAAGLGSGPLTVAPIGDGHSNVTYAIARGDERFVLRRPPRGPLPPSAHDVVREARLLQALAPTGVRVPPVLAVCDEAHVIGAPFYVMPFVAGEVLGERLPPTVADPRRGARSGRSWSTHSSSCTRSRSSAPASPPSAAPRASSSGSCAASAACWSTTRRDRCPSWSVSPTGSPSSGRGPARRPSSTATTGSAT